MFEIDSRKIGKTARQFRREHTQDGENLGQLFFQILGLKLLVTHKYVIKLHILRCKMEYNKCVQNPLSFGMNALWRSEL